MNDNIFRNPAHYIEALMVALLMAAALMVICGCAQTQSYLQSPSGQALLATSEGIAGTAVQAAVAPYGPLASQAAGAGLDALASVLQGYLNKPVPSSIVKASPGIAGVGPAVAPLVSSVKPVTQADVNAVYTAAAIATSK